MMERRQIVALWEQGEAGVLITLVRAEGSSYRRPGARLLTGPTSSSYAGTVSGGCLESEVIRKALWISRNGATVERYSMIFDDTADIPFGLGCGGTVDLLFEPVDSPEATALFQAMARSLTGEEATVVTFLPDAAGSGRPLRRLILDPAGQVIFASASLSAEKIACARTLQVGDVHEGRFVEALRAPQRLFILGAGDDAKPLVRMAALMGWSVIVADGRAQLARADRFPDAEEVFVIGSPSSLQIKSEDAVVLMTHSYEQDRDLLAATLASDCKYLGILGSRHRSSLLVSEVAAQLGRSVASCCERIFAPVGLDLGGDGPEAIAVAIVSELQAVCHQRLGSLRRLTPAEVAEQVESGGASRYLQTHCALNTG